MVDVESRRAYPLFTKQLRKEKKPKKEKSEKKSVGRPKGSKNKNSSTLRLKGLFRIVGWYIRIIRKVIKIPILKYFVYDGAFGNNVGIQTVRRNGLHLVSKLKKNSNLYFKFKGKQKREEENVFMEN